MFGLKNILLVLTLWWFVPSSIASDVDEKRWHIAPFDLLLYHGRELKERTKIHPPLNSKSIIKEITVGEYCDKPKKSFFLYIYLNTSNKKLKEKDFYDFNCKNLEQICCEYLPGFYYECSKVDHFPKFLKIFYDADLIPDSVLDIIIPKLPITDFRMDASFIQQSTKQLKNDAFSKEVQKSILQDLDQIKNQKRHDTIILSMIEELQKFRTHHHMIFIKLLCARIPAQSPFYNDAQKILARMSILEMSNKGPIRERYEISIIKALEADIPEKDTLIKTFLNNGHLFFEDLPLELQNISLSPESMFNLLNYIRKLRGQKFKLAVK
ncbi:MAG: hypothetical protein ACRYGR_02030 [Janthinobacterium lividum]